jgi:hypothetical protein
MTLNVGFGASSYKIKEGAIKLEVSEGANSV